jgi:CheY-like chemotaxis protein
VSLKDVSICPDASPMRVLLADDDPTVRALVSAQLELEGHDVTGVVDGDLALEALAATTPDVLVLDVMMPGQDGWSVLAAVRASAQHATLPVVLLTARDGSADVERGRELGASAVVSKSRVVELLVPTIEALNVRLLPR